MNRIIILLRWLSIFVFCFISMGIRLQSSPAPQADISKLDPLLSLVYQRYNSLARASAPAYRASEDGLMGNIRNMMALDFSTEEPSVPVIVVVRDDGEELRARGIKTLVQVGEVITARVPVTALATVAGLPSVVYVTASVIQHPLVHDVSVPETRAPLARQTYGISGKNVIVAVVDTGIDWRHADFRRSDGKTRIKYLWDMSDKTGPAPADLPESGGTVYTEQQINSALDGGGGVAEADRNGHGTHVTGSAAGNGWATGAGFPAGTYAGMAPEADIIFVKAIRQEGSGFAVDDEIAALKFIDARARELNKPYVVNMSIGGHYGSHDGTMAAELVIDQIFGSGKPGKVICIAAGNEGDDDIHAGGAVSPGGTETVTFSVRDSQASAIMDLWYQGSDSFDVTVGTPTNLWTASISPGGNYKGTAPDGTAVTIESTQANQLNNAKEIFILAEQTQTGKAILAGTWSIRLKHTGNGSGRFDAWMLGNSSFLDHIDPSRRVGMPGTARNAITVASYMTKSRWTDINGNARDYKGWGSSFDTTAGSKSPFSSDGPTRDGRQKPDISAPGQAIASVLSTACDEPNEMKLPDGVHLIMQGTSMASPHVTGAVALLLEANPSLDAAQVKDILTKTARADDFTGHVPNYSYGYGKMDVFEAVKQIRGSTGTTPPAPDPVITLIEPSTLKQGSTVQVAINGANFVGSLGTAVTPSAGITINQTSIVAANRINLNLSVSSTAALGNYQIVVTTDGRRSNPGVFQVVPVNTTSPDIQDSYEPNDNLQSATPLPTDGRITARISPRTDIDVFMFPATQGRKVIFDVDAATLSPASSLDSIIGVFDNYGNLLAYNDDDGKTLDSYLEWTPRATATYYLVVASYSEGESGPGSTGLYVLKVAGHAGDVRADRTAPVFVPMDWAPNNLRKALIITPRILTSTAELFGTWFAIDPESGIDHYEYAVGTTPGAANVINFTRTTGNSIYLSGLTLQNGGMYYLSVKAVNGAGLSSDAVISEPVKINTSNQLYPLYFPRVVAFAGTFTGIAVANPGSIAVQVTYRLYDNSGNLLLGDGIANPVSILLDPGEQLAILSSQLFGMPSTEIPGWVEIQASSPDIKAFYLYGEDYLTFLDGADVNGSPMTDFVFHRVKDVSDDVFTVLSMVNPNSSEGTASLDLRDAGGRVIATQSIKICAKCRQVKLVRDLFPGINQIEAGTIRVRSNQGLVGFELFATGASDVGGMNPQRTSDTTRSLYFAQLAAQGGWFTEISVTNPNDAPVEVELRALYQNGNLINAVKNPVVVQIPAWGQFNASAADTFKFINPDLIIGYISAQVRSGSGGIFGHVVFGTSNNKALAALPVQTQGQTSVVFSQVAQGEGWWTGVTLLNPDAFPAKVRIEVDNAAGQFVGSFTGTLASGAKSAFIISELVPAAEGLFGGYIRVTSDTPVIGFELFGDSSYSFMAAVPPQPVTGSRSAGPAGSAPAGVDLGQRAVSMSRGSVSWSNESLSSKLSRAMRGRPMKKETRDGWVR